MSEWFKTWFDSDYYQLYKDRDHTEALSQSIVFVNPNDTVLDLACGKGRHSIYLNRMGAAV
jgi:2-polyprenyl-3-methyl-5-hydroxy-6-metoxy-1,4-benzoquinol methylase